MTLPVPAWGAASWVACAYWPQVFADNPEEDTPDRIFGRCTHYIASGLIRGDVFQIGQAIPGFAGQFVTDEMMRAAMMYARDVYDNARGQPVYVEHALVAQGRLAPVNVVKPDAFSWVSSSHLVTWELKAGHEFVSAFSNWQLILYLRVILDAWNVDGLRETDLTVEMRVIQPRNFDREGHIRSWTVKASELRAFWNILENRIEEAQGPNPVARTGPHCARCSGRAKCSTFQRHGYLVVEMAGQGVQFSLDGHALGLELRTLQDARDILDARITGLEQEAQAKLEKGQPVEGFAYERKDGKRNWIVADATVRLVGEMYGKELTRSKPITPQQAIDAGVPADVVGNYSRRSTTEKKLIRVEQSHARKIFGQTKE